MSKSHERDPVSPQFEAQAMCETDDVRLAHAAKALLHCHTADDVYELICDFMDELMPGAVIIVNEATSHLESLISRRIAGLNDSLLAKAGALFGFDAVGARWMMRPEYRDEILCGELVELPGGLVELIGREMPRPVAETGAKLLGKRRVLTIGIADGEHALGSIRILARPGDLVPTHMIEAFAHHCYSALFGIRRADDLAESALNSSMILRNMSEGLALHEIILDREGTPIDYRFLDVNPAFETLTSLQAQEIVGRTVLDVLPGTEPFWIERYGAVAITGIPAKFEEYSGELGRHFGIVAYSPQPGQFVTVIEDITDRHRAQQELQHSRDMIVNLTAMVPGVVYQYKLNPDGSSSFPFSSPGIHDIYEVAPEDVREDATPVFGRLHPDDLERVSELIFESARTLQHFHCEFRVVLPRQGTRWRLADAVPQRTEDDGTLWHGIISDITERKEAEEAILRLNAELEERVRERTEELTETNRELLEANKRLAEATHAKSDFLASMSHELRTPLNSIIGFSGVLLRGMAGPLNSEQSLQVGMVNSSGKHLLALVDDVLDLSRIESGMIATEFAEFEAGSLAHTVVEMVRPLAEAKSIELVYECDVDVGTIESDARLVGQILTNLLGNAVKFTDSGDVTLKLSVEDRFMVFGVSDTGRGIAADDIPHVMERFYQATPTVEAKSKGTGLGLAISTRLAEMIGATIDVSSELGVGSVFTLRVPVRRGHHS